MKLKKVIFACTSVLLAVFQASAQNEIDALRYSQLNVVGTARHTGLGGAFGALGGDMTSLHTNPAGIGVFTKSTGSVSIGILSANTDADFQGNTFSNNKLNLNISNAGFVARFKRKKGQDRQWAWKSFQLGVSYSRTANFHRRTSMSAVASNTSVVDSWVDQLNNQGAEYTDLPNEIIPGDPLSPAYMAWQTFLIDTVPGSTNSYLRNVMPNYGQTQQVNELTKGSMGEVAISFGGNFGNALYIGGSVGIPRLNYELERTYTEVDGADTIANFGSLQKRDFLQATGTGFNLKFGVIYRPAKWVRIGAAIHTPSFFEIDETFSSEVTSNLDGVQYTQPTLDGAFDYSLQTPFRAIGSLGFVIGKYGLVSADYEYVNYSQARFSSRNYGFNSENSSVKNRLNWAGNIRVGTEWRIKMLSLRAGFAMNADPYTSQLNFDNTRYSLGAGLRFKHFFVDLAYNLHRFAGNYEVYNTQYIPSAQTVTMEHSVLTTVGFRF